MKWTSRKLFVALTVFGVTTAALWYGHIDQDVWKWATGLTVGGYLLAQGVVDARSK